MIRVFRRLRVTRQQSVSRLLFAVLVAASASCACARVDVDWGERFDLPGMGVARPFAGVSHGVVLLAGGSNFPDRPLVAGGAKVYHDEILMLDPAAAQPMWRVVGRLPRPQGEGGSATTAQGVVCVGGAVGRNAISIIIPCHRVIGMNGSLTGYAGGIERKVQLLTLESAAMEKIFVPTKGTAL